VWVALFGGGCVARYTPDGRLDARVEVPARAATSLCFGGSDRRDLYITTADNTQDAALGASIHRTRVEMPGLRMPLARV
jgi:sugar lactone lactonase YvrE